MAELQFEGYSPFDRGRIYTKDGESFSKIPLREILMVETFTEPTKDGVIDYLVSEASKTSVLSLPSSMEQDVKTLRDLIRVLPTQILTHLKTRDSNCLTFVGQNTPARKIEQGENARRYLHIQYGAIPLDFISAQPAASVDADWYEAILPRLSPSPVGVTMTMQWGITEHPPQQEETQLQVNILQFAKVTETVSIAYAGVRDLFPDFSSVKDATEDHLKSASLPAVKALYQRVAQAIAQEKAREKESREIRRILLDQDPTHRR